MTRHAPSATSSSSAVSFATAALGLVVVFGLVSFIFSRVGSLIPSLPVGSSTTTTTAALAPTTLRLITRNPRNAYDNALRVDVTHASTTTELHSADWRYTTTALTIEQPSSSSSASLLVGNGWRVALRSKEGTVLEDPLIVGTYADREVFVLAHTVVPSAYLVRRGGDVRELARLTDTQHVVGTTEDGIWIVDQEALGSLEQEARGPSSLWYASTSESLRPVTTSSELIVRAMGTPARAAWTTTPSAQLTIRTRASSFDAQGNPMAWFGDTLVFYVRVQDGFLIKTWNEQVGLRDLWTTKDEPIAVELLEGDRL